jgi:hypothetical protein
MPQCRHCERELPSSEVRRTKLGFVCKERSPRELGKFSRCVAIARELRAQRRRPEARRQAA